MSVKQKKHKASLASLEVSGFLDYREFLKNFYEAWRTQSKPKKTHKDFSEFLGFDRENNTIRLVISGKRNLSQLHSKQICSALNLTKERRRYFLTLVDYCDERKQEKRQKIFLDLIQIRQALSKNQVDVDQLEYCKKWFHPTIFEALRLGLLAGSPEEIQNSLVFPLRLDEIKFSLEVLERIGLLGFEAKTNSYFPLKKQIWVDGSYNKLAVTQYHQQMIAIAADSITRVESKDRVIEALTLSVNQATLDKIRNKIAVVLDEVMQEEEQIDEADQVYQLNLQLFPLTKK